MEGSDARIEGDYKIRTDAIKKCFQVARARQMVVFAIQNGGMCLASAARDGYDNHGKSNRCTNDWSKGGPRANNVYRITNPIKPIGLIPSFKGMHQSYEKI